jgi:DNA-binding CsgD family transcriptional regulator
MRCPYCEKEIHLPQDKETRWVRFLEALERNNHNRTHTARELGVSVRSVRLWCKSLGLGYYREPSEQQSIVKERKWTKDEVATMIALGKKKFTYAVIAKELGRTTASVRRQAHLLYRLQKQREAMHKVHLTASMIRRQRILGMHRDGISAKVIAKELGLTLDIVKMHLKDWKEKRR